MNTGVEVTMQEAVQAVRAHGEPRCFEQVAVRRERTSRAADGTIAHGLHGFQMPLVGRPISATLIFITVGVLAFALYSAARNRRRERAATNKPQQEETTT